MTDILTRIYLAKLDAEMTPSKPTKVFLGANERKELEAVGDLAPWGLAVIANVKNNYLEVK